MAKGSFADIGGKIKTLTQEEFVSGAKVDGSNPPPKKTRVRRGRAMTDPTTGRKVTLGGTVLEIPLNAEELEIFKQAAKKAGLPVATYVRSTILGINKG